MKKPWIIKSNINRRKIKNKKFLYNLYIVKKLSTRKIAKLLNIGNGTVSRTLKRMKIKTTPIPKYNKFITKNRLKTYHYNQNLTLKQISKIFHCSANTIASYMNKFNLSIKINILNNNPNWRGGLIKTKCSYCKKTLYIKRSRIFNNNYCSQECLGKYQSISLIGNQNPNYKHGLSYLPYPIEWNSSLKESIRKRDNYTCQLCNKKQINLTGFHKKLDVHHIDYNKFHCNKSNLITLCKKCNSNVNSNRDYWYAYFRYMVE